MVLKLTARARQDEAPVSRSLELVAAPRTRLYRGGVSTETVGSWADIKVFVPGTQGEPCRGAPLPQSARNDVGCAANATPMANTAAAATVTFRRCLPQPYRLVQTPRMGDTVRRPPPSFCDDTSLPPPD